MSEFDDASVVVSIILARWIAEVLYLLADAMAVAVPGIGLGEFTTWALRASRLISPIFGVFGEQWCAVGDFPTKAIAIAMDAGEKFATACQGRRKTK